MTNYPANRSGVVLPIKITVGVTSCLSIVGALLIVLTFCLRVCSKPRQRRAGHPNEQTEAVRTPMLSPGRFILVNLSIADIFVAASHLWGVAAGYETLFGRSDSELGTTNTWCDMQGAMAVYATIASFLWTIILSFFVVGTLVLPHPRRYGSLRALLLYLVLCWGVPAVVLVILAVRHEFGLDYGVTIGQCSASVVILVEYSGTALFPE